MTWVNFDGEWWDEYDRFGVMPCPNGWYGWDTATSETSDSFGQVEDAKRWCQEIADSEAITPAVGM
jgi:hypothetical protein